MQNGLSVKVVTTNMDIEEGSITLDKWIDTNYGQVRYCSTLTHYFPFSLIWNSLKSLHRVDIVHLTALFYPPSFIIGVIASLVGKKVVWSVRGELHPAALKFNRLIKFFYLQLIRNSGRRNIVFHATSEDEANYIRKRFGYNSSFVILPNFIELPKKLYPCDNYRYLLYMGRIHPIKSLDKLITGLSKSNAFKNSSYVLKISGAGDKSYIETLINKVKTVGLQEKVEFIGLTVGEDKEVLYANAKATFLVSESENFGNVVVESLTHGTPVICSLGTPWKILNEKKAGYWISNDPHSISKVVDQLVSGSEIDYMKMRANAEKLAKTTFDIDTNVYRWKAVYNKLISSRHKNSTHSILRK